MCSIFLFDCNFCIVVASERERTVQLFFFHFSQVLCMYFSFLILLFSYSSNVCVFVVLFYFSLSRSLQIFFVYLVNCSHFKYYLLLRFYHTQKFHTHMPYKLHKANQQQTEKPQQRFWLDSLSLSVSPTHPQTSARGITNT